MDNHYKIFQESTTSSLFLATIIYDKFLDSAKKIWDNGMLTYNANTGLKYCEPDSSLRNAIDLGCIECSLEDMFKDKFYKEALISVLIGSKKTSENRENVERFIYYITYHNQLSKLFLHFCTFDGAHSNKDLSFLGVTRMTEKDFCYEFHIYIAAPLNTYRKFNSPEDIKEFLMNNSHILIHELIHVIDMIRSYYLRDRNYFIRNRIGNTKSKNDEDYKIAYYSSPKEVRAFTFSLINLIEEYMLEAFVYKLDKKDFQSVDAFRNFFMQEVREELYNSNEKLTATSYDGLFKYMPQKIQKQMVKKIADYFTTRGKL